MTWRPLPGPDDHTRELDSVLRRLNRTLGLARPDTVQLLEQHWTALVGSALAARCQVDSVRHGELVVVTSDPAVAEQLKWTANDLVGAVNAVCDGDAVTSVTVRVRPTTR